MRGLLSGLVSGLLVVWHALVQYSFCFFEADTNVKAWPALWVRGLVSGLVNGVACFSSVLNSVIICFSSVLNSVIIA